MSDPEINDDRMYARLCAALQQLSWDASEQRDWIAEMFLFMTDKIGDMWNIGELGLEYGDAYGFVPQLIEQGFLKSEQKSMLDDIDQKISQISGMENAELWTVKALSTEIVWQDIREMAREALSKIDCQDD